MSKQSCPLSPGSLVWAYLRVSGDEQADRGLPIAGQRQRADDYAGQHQLVIARWFVDEAKSGGSTAGRDAFNEMIDLSRQKPVPVDGILIWDLKRFARNLLDSQFYKADLRRRGYMLIFLSDDIPATDFAPVYESLLEWKAQKDRNDIAKDTQRGLQVLARLGYAPGGFPPRGYQAEVMSLEIEGKCRQVRRWVADPEYWDLARKAWEMRAAGSSLDQILQQTRLFKSQGCLTSFFANKTYLGVRKCGDLQIENAHQPLISRYIWDKVQAQRTARGVGRRGRPWTDNHPRRTSTQYLLSGLLYCGQCGAAMCGSRVPARDMKDGHRKEWRFYICGRRTRQGMSSCPSSKLKASAVEEAVLAILVGDVLTVDRLEDLINETNAALSDRRSDLAERQVRLQHDLARLDTTISRLLDALEGGETRAVRDRLGEREGDRLRLEADLAGVTERLQHSHMAISRAALTDLVAHAQATLQTGDITQSRELLRTLVIRIEATKKGGLLYYTFPFRLAPTPTVI